jgi:hypothetical protein
MYDASVLLEMSKKVRPQTTETTVRWEFVHREDGRVILFPVDPPPVLFRGQNRRHAPSFPSICRGFQRVVPRVSDLALDDQASLVINLAKSWWFCQELDLHPAMQWANSQSIHVDQIALAQHYELPTGYMDVSQSFDVAAFFATCYRDGLGWHPISTGIGVMYRIEYLKVEHPLSFASAIGLQPFPRPTEQWGWVIELQMGVDFESLPVVSRIEFKHDKAVSQHFLELFDHGKALFPPDPMSDVADTIKHSNTVPRDLIDAALEDFTNDDFGLTQVESIALRDTIARKVSLVEPFSVLSTQDMSNIERIWNQRNDAFFNGVTFRLVKTRHVMEKTPNAEARSA